MIFILDNFIYTYFHLTSITLFYTFLTFFGTILFPNTTLCINSVSFLLLILWKLTSREVSFSVSSWFLYVLQWKYVLSLVIKFYCLVMVYNNIFCCLGVSESLLLNNSQWGIQHLLLACLLYIITCVCWLILCQLDTY